MHLKEIRRKFSRYTIWRHWDKKPIRPCKWDIVDLFLFRGVIFGRGKVETKNGERPKIFLCLSPERIFSVEHKSDPHVPSGAGLCTFAFCCIPEGDLSPRSLEQASIVFEFDGFLCEAANFVESHHRSDAFLSSGKCFWEAVGNAKEGQVLEIGSRARSGIVRRNLFPDHLGYTGFDILPGENVDVVGDAHFASKHLPRGFFDFAFSVSVWEHLRAPWVAVAELNRVMKKGGLVMVNTHQSWPYHEGPWDYFRFSGSSWESLFNEASGFEIVEAVMGERCCMVPTNYYDGLSDGKIDWEYGYLASRCVAKKISETDLEWKLPVLPSQASSYPA